MEVLLLLVTGVVNLLCFAIGAKLGQTVVKGKEIKLPSINPMDAIRTHNEKKKAEIEQDKFETIMRNIECYDGTGKGQEDVGR